MKKQSFLILLFTLLLPLLPKSVIADTPAPWRVTAREDVAKVWSGCPVGFHFMERDGHLFIAFYGEDQSMTVGRKRLPDGAWEFKTLPTKIGWDSHNGVTMTFDRDNILHVSGNMHCVPLLYFRATEPLDIHSLETVNRMTGELENRVTYPQFITDLKGRLLFTYRHGQSGNGIQLWNRYDPDTRTWTRFRNCSMFDGEGECNAYFVGPVFGPDTFFHVAYVWRDTPDCATNHDLSYMRSLDLEHWETSDGRQIVLPVTPTEGETVAPLKIGEGLLNSHVRIGFDAEKRVILTYTRYDENGNNQLMQARLEDEEWKIYQTTDWTHRWEFTGGGCIPTELSFRSVELTEDGKLVQWWRRDHEKSGEFELDPATLKPIGPAPKKSAIPAECRKNENPQENQQPRSAQVLDPQNPNRLYYFTWETLPINRDRPHAVTPVPSTLRMFILER